MEQPEFCKNQRPALPWEATIFSSAIQQMVEAGDSSHYPGTHHHPQKTKTTPFHVPAKPAFIVEEYVRRIHRLAPDCEPAAYVVAYVYIRRFLERKEKEGEPFPVTSLSFRRLVLLGLMVAEKNLSQTVYTNAHYAQVGGMSTDEMNRLEVLFLLALKFDLHVDAEEFESCYAYLECSHREASRRSWRQLATAGAMEVGKLPCEGGGQRADHVGVAAEEHLLAHLETCRLLGS